MKKELLIPSALAVILAATSVAPAFAGRGDEDNHGKRVSAFARIKASVEDEDNHGSRVSAMAKLNAQSQDDDDDSDGRADRVRAFFKGLLKNKGEAKLEANGSLEKRLARIVARYDENHDKHVNAYTRLYTRLTDFEARVEAAGYNTDELEAHLVVFNGLVLQFKADYAAYIEALRDAHEMSVNGSTSAEVEAQLQVAKDKLLVAKASGMAARDYYKTTIKADIAALKLLVEAEGEASI